MFRCQVPMFQVSTVSFREIETAVTVTAFDPASFQTMIIKSETQPAGVVAINHYYV